MLLITFDLLATGLSGATYSRVSCVVELIEIVWVRTGRTPDAVFQVLLKL